MPALKLFGNGATDYFGTEFAIVGKPSNTPGPALVVGAPRWRDLADPQAEMLGRVYVFSQNLLGGMAVGQPTVVLDAEACADYIITGMTDGGLFGTSIESADLTGLGTVDVILVGEPGSTVTDGLGGIAGDVHVFDWLPAPPPGSTGCLGVHLSSDFATTFLRGRAGKDRFGHAIERLDDFIGGPGMEFAVGAPQVQDQLVAATVTGAGYVEVYTAIPDGQGGLTINFVAALDGTQVDPTETEVGSGFLVAGEGWGWALSADADFDDDGIGDLAIGALRYNLEDSVGTYTEELVGRVVVYSTGSAFATQLFTDTASPAGTKFIGEGAGDFFGFSVQSAAGFAQGNIPVLLVDAYIENSGDEQVSCPVECGSAVTEPRAQGGRKGGILFMFHGVSGALTHRIQPERKRDHIGWDVIVADLIGDGQLDVICGGLGWAHPDDEAAENQKTEVGRVYIFGGEQF